MSRNLPKFSKTSTTIFFSIFWNFCKFRLISPYLEPISVCAHTFVQKLICIHRGVQKTDPHPKSWFFDKSHLCCWTANFLWSTRDIEVKFHEESKYFIRILPLVSTLPYLLFVFMRKSAKPPCVQTNPNYHQGTPGPPEWAGFIESMMRRVEFIQ